MDVPVKVTHFLDKMDGVYVCFKDSESRFIWANQNFLDLIGSDLPSIVGTSDPRLEHVAHDKEVMKAGKPLLNFYETIEVPKTNRLGLKACILPIITQKGLLRDEKGSVTGISVNFSFAQTKELLQEKVHELALEKIPIGGYFAPANRSGESISHLPMRFNHVPHNLYSTNYFLLPALDHLQLHSLNIDEQWFYYDGPALDIHIFDIAKKDYKKLQVSRTSRNIVVPHGTWFGAMLSCPNLYDQAFSLSSCSLAPGFDKSDSKLPTIEEKQHLFDVFPQHKELLQKLLK